MIITCTHCIEQVFEDYDFCTHCSRNETYYFCSKTCKHEWLLTTTAEGRRDSEVRVMPVLETPAVKNPFCRRSGRNQRSGRERRMSVDSAKYSVDRRSGVDRRKGQDRRKHDYWDTNYRYWNTTVWWPEIGAATVQPSVIHFSKNMKNIAYYILWGILVLLLISFSTALLETILHARIHYYIINTVFVLALVALHYFKFRKSWIYTS